MAVRRRKRKNRPDIEGRDRVKAMALPADHDHPVALLKDISEGRVDPRTLNADQRRACLVVMANGHQTSAELAHIFGVSPQTIRGDMKLIRERFGREVGEWTLEEALGDLAHCAEKFSAQAFKQGDVGLAWQIKREFIRALKDLGVLGGQEGNGLTVTIEGLAGGYERARKVLATALDPALTGEVIEADYEVRSGDKASFLDPALTGMGGSNGSGAKDEDSDDGEGDEEED